MITAGKRWWRRKCQIVACQSRRQLSKKRPHFVDRHVVSYTGERCACHVLDTSSSCVSVALAMRSHTAVSEWLADRHHIVMLRSLYTHLVPRLMLRLSVKHSGLRLSALWSLWSIHFLNQFPLRPNGSTLVSVPSWDQPITAAHITAQSIMSSLTSSLISPYFFVYLRISEKVKWFSFIKT